MYNVVLHLHKCLINHLNHLKKQNPSSFLEVFGHFSLQTLFFLLASISLFHCFFTHFHQLPKFISTFFKPPLSFRQNPPSHHFIFHSYLTVILIFLLLGFFVIMEAESSPERKRHQKGGKILRYEPSNCNEINSYPFIK